MNTGKKSQPRQKWGCRRDTSSKWFCINLLWICHKRTSNMKGPTNSNFGYAKNVSCWNCSLNYSQNRFWFWDKRDVKGKYHFRCWKSFVREFRKLLRMLPLRGRTSKSQRLCATAGTTIQQAWQKIVKGMFFQAWKENIQWKDMRKKGRNIRETDSIHSFCFYSFLAETLELMNYKTSNTCRGQVRNEKSFSRTEHRHMQIT